MNRSILAVLSALLAVLSLLPWRSALGAPEAAEAFHPGKIHIALVGDSTVTDNAGWGKGFAACMKEEIEVINLSKGGRSSKSAIAEGMLKRALDLKPDYLLIQFGHNDQPGHGDRETDPQTTYKQYMTQYVDEARAAGVNSILVTSLSRRQWTANGKITSTLTPWVDVVKQIAAEKNVPLIDLHARSIEFYNQQGKEKILGISPTKNADPTSKNADTAATENQGYDGTHLNEKGSHVIGRIVAEELKKAVPGLASHVITELPVLHGKTPFAEARMLTVSADGKGEFKSVEEAVAAAPDNSKERTVIHISAGTYKGPIEVPKSKTNLSFEGDGAEKTILTWDRNVDDPIPEQHTQFNPGLHIAAIGFRAENVTIQNTSGDHGQALAMRIDADRAVLKNCRLLGWQDTLMINKGRQYFQDCYIEGRVDFIYGDGTAVFVRCEIHSKAGGYLTAASTPQDHPYGFVFLSCKISGDAMLWTDPTGAKTPKPQKDYRAYLGRPWLPSASVTFINCEMGELVQPEGWHNWGKVENESTARYAEYNSSGPGAAPDKRVSWSKQLSKEEAEKITVERVLGGSDNWKPE